MKMNKKSLPFLNADLGEGCKFDAEIMALVDAANIACGGHTGDEQTMAQAVALAKVHKVIVGAHPSYCDPTNFGRQSLFRTQAIDKIALQIINQVKSLYLICQQQNVQLHYVKPHGALYHDMALNSDFAKAIYLSINKHWPELRWVGLAHSEGLTTIEKLGAQVVPEAFIDRTYLENGQLVPRGQTDLNPVLHHPEDCLAQAKQLSLGEVTAINGRIIPLKAKTLCLHGDNQQALAIAKQIRKLIPKKFA